MGILYVMQVIGGCIMATGYIPQLRQMVRTKSVRDLNIKTFIALSIGLVMMESYAIGLVVHDHTGDAFLITNTLGLILNTVVVILIVYYRSKAPAPPVPGATPQAGTLAESE